MKIVLNLIATNKYISFLDIICPSIEEFFFPEVDITAIVHTNLDLPENLEQYKRIKFVKNEIQHEPWPFTTLKRFEYFLLAKKELSEADYCFYIDVDSLFVKEISTDMLKVGMFGTIHPCLFVGPGSPERNPESKACIPIGSDSRYFCGGFFGGSSEEFIKMSESILENIQDDLARGIIAVWHDESHLNRYFYDNPPALVLDHPFAVAENMTQIKEESKVLFLDKSVRGGHDFFRS